MKDKSMGVAKTGMKIGAVLGGIAFLIFGIVPGFHYGAYGTLMLLSKIVGGPVEFSLGLRMIVVVGIALGIVCLGSLSIVIGSVVGTISGYLVNSFSVLREPAIKEELIDNRH